MTKLDKVIKELEELHGAEESMRLITETLELLKTQVPVEPIINEQRFQYAKCRKCGQALRWKANYCHRCGQAVNWE